MKLTFIYQSVTDLPAALAFYRDQLGFKETWREGDSTVGFELPGSSVQLMLDARPSDEPRWKSGAVFAVDDVAMFIKENPNLGWISEATEIPGGKAATFVDTSGNVLHVADQGAEPAFDS